MFQGLAIDTCNIDVMGSIPIVSTIWFHSSVVEQRLLNPCGESSNLSGITKLKKMKVFIVQSRDKGIIGVYSNSITAEKKCKEAQRDIDMSGGRDEVTYSSYEVK